MANRKQAPFNVFLIFYNLKQKRQQVAS